MNPGPPGFLLMAQPVLSPCVGICTVNIDGLCEGCFRSLHEIGQWLNYNDTPREYIMHTVLPTREAKV